ncbi:hypothetical protein C8R45DRAFT_935548 [Mycena sanguinolenta]|nr:hypothetical protein C8R45DRAFT_935548 [Mycena sanguinolenta]
MRIRLATFAKTLITGLRSHHVSAADKYFTWNEGMKVVEVAEVAVEATMKAVLHVMTRTVKAEREATLDMIVKVLPAQLTDAVAREMAQTPRPLLHDVLAQEIMALDARVRLAERRADEAEAHNIWFKFEDIDGSP